MSRHGGDIWSLGASHGLGPEQILDFSSSLNPFGVPASVRRLLSGSDRPAMVYPDAEYGELRQGLGDWLGLPMEQIVVGNGASELIRELLLVLRPKTVMVVEPGFSEYARAARLLDMAVIGHRLDPSDDFTLDPLALIRQIERDRPDLVFVCNPNNPSSRQLDFAAMSSIARACAAAGGCLVVDETFIELSRLGTAASLAPLLTGGQSLPATGLIVLRAFTKIFALAGLRVGYLATDRGLAARLRANQVPWTVNGYAARLGGLFNQETQYLRQTAEWLASEPDRLHTALQGQGLARVVRPDSNFILCRLGDGMDAAGLRLRLLASGILIRDCGNFTGLGPQWFRVAVRQRAENQRLVAALSKILSA